MLNHRFGNPFCCVIVPEGMVEIKIESELSGNAQGSENRTNKGMMNSVVPSPDGRHLAYGYQAFDSNVWILQKF